jgi:hypothetical protein
MSVREYVVYVVELEDAACRRADCPARRAGKPHVYVGETSKSAEERFAVHKAGGVHSGRIVFKHGVRLRPKLARGFGPYTTREDARAGEAALAERLRARNFCVFGGH